MLWEDILRYFLKAQLHSEDKVIDGVWARAFDVNLKEVYRHIGYWKNIINLLSFGKYKIERKDFAMKTLRKVKRSRKVYRQRTERSKLVRVIGYNDTKDYDPFLMLDAFDSVNPDDYTKGFPWHPHRGIETVTYLINGNIEHGDSLGNKGVIRDGDCQWMTAGSGIIHQEMPKASPRMLGAQLWLNLPAKDKMTLPAYGDIRSEDIPKVEKDGVTIRILSGEYEGQKGALRKVIKAVYLDVELSACRSGA